MIEDACGDAQALQGPGPEDPAASGDSAYDKVQVIGNPAREHGSMLYTSGSIEDIFRCISMVCTRNAMHSPLKSNPVFRPDPPRIRLVDEAFNCDCGGDDGFSFHLPRDYRFLYSAAPLAYYLGASVRADDSAYVSFSSRDPMGLPDFPDFERWAGEALRRTFYLDCAVRYAFISGGLLNGLDVKTLLGRSAKQLFRLGPEERFFLYSDPRLEIPGLPAWHMAAYLDPVPGSVEALPFLLHSLSAIYTPRSVPMTERGIVSISIQDFLGRPKRPEPGIVTREHSIVVPSLCGARSNLWFSEGFPVDAAKAYAHAFQNHRKCVRVKKKGVNVGIICNEDAMSHEVDAIIDALSDTRAFIKVNWDASVRRVLEAFAGGFDIVQLIGHCDSRGFKCRDGFAKVSDVRVNNTPMFFFNSCASYREAEGLVRSGSVCGVATLFRVLEEAAVDVCKNFYRVLGAGYSASIALDAARECSVLGKEYLLIGDGSFACFGGDGLKPFYRIGLSGQGCTLGCTLGNVEKGNVIGSWSPGGKNMVSDLGFETRFLSAEHLAAIAGKFKGFCLYDRNIYSSVDDAVRRAVDDARDGLKKRPRWHMAYAVASLGLLFLSLVFNSGIAGDCIVGAL